MSRASGEPLRASIIAGCIVSRDAISNIARQQADALSMPLAGGPTADVRLFTMGGNVSDSRIVEVPSAAAIIADAHFQSSDIIVFHFGIRYPAFDAILLAPRTAHSIGYYHGITPPALLNETERTTLAESFCQANNLFAADRVQTTSLYIQKELESFGLASERITRVAPAVSFQPIPRRPVKPGRPLRFLYVGRFVASKGISDLMAAFAKFASRNADAVLDLAGSTAWCDPEYLAHLRELAKSPLLRNRVRFHHDLSASELARRYAEADVFVFPSYHEGFGVPIVEALMSGCYVICSDAGASPETAGGLGRVFPTGDVASLATRFAQVEWAWQRGVRPTAMGLLTAEEWGRQAREYASDFSQSAYEDRFRTAVFSGLRRYPTGVAKYLANKRWQLLDDLPAALGKRDDEPAICRTFREGFASPKGEQRAA